MFQVQNLIPGAPNTAVKMLVVEDEFLIANELRYILQNAGYQVTGMADSVAEALELIAESAPDVVLLDIFLKGNQTGIDLAQYLRERHIPFVFLSANSNESILEEAKKTQPYGFLTKPFREQDVLTTLEIARYRHAHSTEAKLRQEKALQIAVNNALLNIKDLGELCRAIAGEIDRIVRFQAFDLRIRLRSDVTTFSTCLWKQDDGQFEPEEALASAALGRGKFEWSDIQTGVFTGTGFSRLCDQHQHYRIVSKLFGFQSLMRLRLHLDNTDDSDIVIFLFDTRPSAFQPADFETVTLILPQISLALENLLAFENLRRKEEEKTQLLSLNQQLSGVQTREDLFAFFHQHLKAHIDFEDVTISLIHPDETHLHSLLAYRKKDALNQTQYVVIETDSIAYPGSVVEEDAQSGKVRPCDIEDWVRRKPGNAEVQNIREWGSKTGAAVPLKAHGRTYAVLYLFSRQENIIKYHQLSFLESIGNAIALTLSKIFAFDEIESREREKTTLLTISEHLATAQDRCDLFSLFYENLSTILGFEEGSFRIIDAEADKYYTIGCLPRTQPAGQPHYQVFQTQKTRYRGSMVEEDARYGAARLVNMAQRAAQHPAAEEVHAAVETGIRSAVVIPLKQNGRPFGLVYFFSRQENAFRKEQLSLFENIGNQVSVTLTNIFAKEEIEAREREKALQVAINNALITIKDRKALCRAIADQVNRQVPFTFMALRIGLLPDPNFYTDFLQKAPDDMFGHVNPVVAYRSKGRDTMATLQQESNRLNRQGPGLYVGEAFERLCTEYQTYRDYREVYGVQSLMRLPLYLQSVPNSVITLADPAPFAFTPADYELISRLMPQISLALENLFAFEEMESREQLKATELAVVNAFRNGKDMKEIALKAATAINVLIPLDLLSFFRADHQLESFLIDVTVGKQDGTFVPLVLTDFFPGSNPTAEQEWQRVRQWDCFPEPRIDVGEQQKELVQRNAFTRMIGENLGFRSSMHVPILIKNHPVASVVLASKAAYAFTQKDLAALQGLSNQMALALENLLAYEQIQSMRKQLELEKTYLNEEIKTAHNFEEIIGSSPALLGVFRSIGQVAPTDVTVLILGETGTGKELIARAIHNLSPRKGRPVVKVNCAALPPQLIESELFGHEKGSFTGATEKRIGKFELAHGGTIFLDEIGEMPLELQPKLLRVLQEKEIERIGGKGPIPCDARIIAATNRNLQHEVAEGRFRPDLYYRLNVFPITLPPLRERKEDLLPLITYFLQKITKKLGKTITGIADASLQQMQGYHWPGNIRELEHLLERAAILSQGTTLELSEPLLPQASLPGTGTYRTSVVIAEAIPVSVAKPAAVKPFQEAERESIVAALEQTGYRIRGKGGAAELLGLKPTTLEAKMKKLKIVRLQAG